MQFRSIETDNSLVELDPSWNPPWKSVANRDIVPYQYRNGDFSLVLVAPDFEIEIEFY